MSVELLLEGLDADPTSEGDRRARHDLVTALTDWWATYALERFQATPINQQAPPMTFTMNLLGAPVSFGVRYDENLLADLLEAYTVHGWRAVELVESTVKALPKLLRPTLDFIRATRNVLAVMVSDALMRIEDMAIRFARQRWEESDVQLNVWLSKFFVPPSTRTPFFEDKALGEKLAAQCLEYAKLRAKVIHLQEKIDERNRVVPASRRVEGSGADLWFEVYASPQRELLPKLADQLVLIGRMFPAAVLVVDSLPEKVLDQHDQLRRAEAAVALAGEIHRRLTELTTQLDGLLKTLDKPPVTATLATVVEPVRAGDLSGLAGLLPPKGGYEQQVMDAAFLRTEPEDQRLFTQLGLLAAMQDTPDLVEQGSMNQIVLFRYVTLLATEIDRNRERAAFVAKVWMWVERIAAALALIAMMAVFPVGEAAAPALAATLTLAGTAAAIIGAVVLVLHQIVGALQEAGELDRKARDELFRLGQNDPQALTDIAQALDRSRTLREAIATGALATVLTLGAQRKIAAVSQALELKGVVDDVETVLRRAEDGAEGDVGTP